MLTEYLSFLSELELVRSFVLYLIKLDIAKKIALTTM